jgi:hypothetical protein
MRVALPGKAAVVVGMARLVVAEMVRVNKRFFLAKRVREAYASLPGWTDHGIVL